MMKIYSVLEAAQELDLHIDTIRRYIRTGKLKAVRKGQMWLITQDDLDFLQNSEWFQLEKAMGTGRPKKRNPESTSQS